MPTPLILVLLLAFAMAAHAALPSILRYRLTDDAVEMVLCGFLNMFYLRYEDIERARVATAWEVILCRKAINRVWGPFVVAFRSSGLRTPVVFSPADPESFLREIRERSVRKHHFIAT